MSKDAINATLAMCGYHEMRDGEPNPACERCADSSQDRSDSDE
jgi:hypothetical protein